MGNQGGADIYSQLHVDITGIMHWLRKCTTLMVVLLLLGPATASTLGNGDAEPLADESTRFTDVTREAGFPNDLARTRVAWGDYDGDGWEDLLLDGRMLWRNDKDGTFTDVTSAAGITGVASHGGVWADYDNDGDQDFYANVRSRTARDALWRNDGDGTFTDVSNQAGDIYDFLPTEGVAWGDYDNDGFVDLYVANYETASVDPDAELGIGTPDALYRNVGDGTFEDMSSRAGVELDGDELCGRGVVWCDYDDDSDYDIYVSNYRLDPNLLWRNDGDGTFTNVAADARVEGYSTNDAPGSPRFGHSIGSDFGDYDNDGDMDLYVSNLAHPRFIMFSDKSMLMNNRGGGTFVDRWYGSGIDYCETSSDPSWADYDNDGDLDLYYTAVYEGVGSRMFRNVERDRFEDSTEESRTAVEDGWGTGWCDYDHDGDLDLAVGSQTEFRLFENGGNENHWLQVKLEGTWSNSLAIGARVKVTAGTLEMVRDVKGGRGTTSQDMFTCHFGLDDYDGDVEVAVRWPGLDTYTFVGEYSVDHRVLVSEGDVDIDASIALEVDPDSPRVGEAVDLVAIVRNEGVTTIDSVEVTFTVQGVGPVGESIRVDPIAPGESVSPGTIWQPLAEGVFTVVAQIIDVVPFDTNGDNDVSSVVVTVRITNTEPIARLRVDRTKAPPGLDITFDGSESSDDSSVGRYLFEFDDGTTNDWITSPVTTHSYSIEGEYLVSLTVEDWDGLRSTNFATMLITITSKGFRPTADIITILPSPARLGETVTLHGRGTAVAGANITGHSWNSSIDGHIGDQALVTTTQLSLGEHTIFYKVHDDLGLWSDPVTALLLVTAPEGRWTVRIDEPREGANPFSDYLTVRGIARYTTAPVVSVEVRVDNEAWEEADGTEDWTYRLDLMELEDGPHTIRVRASSLDSASEPVMVNITLGEIQDPSSFDYMEWLVSWQGMIFVFGIVALILANVWVSRRRRRKASLG